MPSPSTRGIIRFTFTADDNSANLPHDIPAEIAYRYSPGDSSVGVAGQVEILSVLPLFPEMSIPERHKLSDLLLGILENDELPYGREAREKCAEDVGMVLAGEG